MSRIPSLDGLRTIAVALVLVCHFGNDYGVVDFLDSGVLGVRVFFVISGFLITGLLLKELDRTGDISLRQFYFRRTLRIFPAFYVYLLVMLALGALGLSPLTPFSSIPAFTYTSNYWVIPEAGYATSHTWSLATEEQFYLLWPALLWLTGRRYAPYLLLFVVLSSPLLRAAVYLRGDLPSLYAAHLNLDHIGMGCLLAFWRDRLHSNALYMRLLTSRIMLGAPIFILIASAQGNHPSIHRTLLLFLINVLITLCIDWAVTFHRGIIGRELNRPWSVWIGTLSYSIYLWQQPFTHLNFEKPALIASGTVHTVLNNPMVALACILACAATSHYLVERPFLRLRDRHLKKERLVIP